MERSIIFSFFQLLHYPHYSCTAETLIAGYMLLISRIDLENCFGTWPCLFRRYNHPFHSPSFTRPQPFSPLFFGLSANFCQHYFKKKKKKFCLDHCVSWSSNIPVQPIWNLALFHLFESFFVSTPGPWRLLEKIMYLESMHTLVSVLSGLSWNSPNHRQNESSSHITMSTKCILLSQASTAPRLCSLLYCSDYDPLPPHSICVCPVSSFGICAYFYQLHLLAPS